MGIKRQYTNYFIKIASYWILIKIQDEELCLYIREQYLLLRKPQAIIIEGSIEVFSHKTSLVYTLRSRTGSEQFKIQIPMSSNMAFKEFLLQGLIELCVFKKNIFFIHGSSIYNEKDTHVFIGSSGAGKTTIIRLLNIKTQLSNDTVVCQYKDGRYIIHSSPFDKKENIKLSIQKIGTKINIYDLVQSPINNINYMNLKEKIEVLHKNLNFFMLTAQVDVTSHPSFLTYHRKAYLHILTLVKRATIRKLEFTLKITSGKFYSLK